MLDVEMVTDAVAYHGEGPVWDGGVLHFVDMLAGDVLSLAPDGELTRRHLGKVVATVRPRRAGGLVLALERAFAVLDPGAQRPRVVAEAFDDESVRMNDGGCDPQGRFYCGSMAYDASPGRGTLYRLDPDGSVHVVLSGVSISNGLAWSPDGGTVYYIDTPTNRVDAFDFDAEAGTFANRRTVVEIPPEAGHPDGMTVDAEGGLWVALWDGSAVHRYTPDGTLDEVVRLPVRRVTACAFGGPDLDQLYITTSRQDLSDPEPEAGALFRTVPGVRGMPTLPFAG